MPRIFIPHGGITGDTATLPEAEAKRLSRVLRMGPGEHVTLFDGSREYSAVITSINSKSAVLKITASEEKHAEPPIRIAIGQGLPKGEKLEWALQKAVELGVTSFVPVILLRSVKRPDMEGIEKGLARLRRIATEAAQQSGRLVVPDVPCYMDLGMFVEATKGFELKVVLYEGEKTRGLKEVIRDAFGVRSVSILVGPEGGLAKDEVDEAEAAGFVPVGLGPRILRTETAGLAAISVIQYELGDIG